MDIELLKPYQRNAKKHDKKQITKVADSIKRFGFVQSIVVDKNNEVVIGHARLEAAKLLNLKEVPTISVEKLTDEEVKALRLADNKLNESEWDMGLAIEELKGLSPEMFDLTGFDADLLIEPDEKDDEIPENPPTVAKLGDVWQLGRHRVMCGDSTKKEDVEKLMDGNKADMVFTDPPYGMKLDTNFGDGMGQCGIFKSNKNYDKVIGDNDDFSDSLILTIFENYNYCKEIFIFGVDYFAEIIPQRKIGSWLVWDKKEQGKEFDFTLSEFELIWSKNKHSRKIFRTAWRGLIGLGTQDTKKRVHPTQKPLELLNNILLKYSKESNIIIDLFLGSGSTLIACEKTNRICYGMELDEYYCDVIIKRYEDYTNNKAVKL